MPVVSDYEVLKRIYDVLREREMWLEEQGLDVKTVMDYEQGGRFLTWAQERFAQMEDEKFRDDANRYSAKSEYQVGKASSSFALRPRKATPRWQRTDIGSPELLMTLRRRLLAAGLRKSQRLQPFF